MEEKKSRTDFIIQLKEKNTVNFTLLKFALVAVTCWIVKLVWML